ncbi:MAG: fluoride efflux transporter CrcB [Abitibacteriaceae bacterium]|nr:fluoride efflux transporter CrcB [Abditibacteriaceae bacterium]MBV9865340.1 fluoride efflux transporter CrcB [Abditibacteriaceae bacterium]
MRLLWIMLAGALGTGARYGFGLAVQRWLSSGGARTVVGTTVGADFPLGTLLINVTGALILAFVATLAMRHVVSSDLRLVLGTGFCGGYTTFSTFAFEADQLLSNGDWRRAVLYIGGNLLLGLVAIWIGRFLALRLMP